MRVLATTVYVALAIFLSSCNQRQPVSDIDPKLGRECFESHRAALPPGSQYEGVDGVAENRLTIRVMNGVEVVKVDCILSPDRKLKSTAKAG